MTDKVKKVIRLSGIGLLVLGSIGVYIGGGSEGYAVEVVSGIFIALAFIMSKIKE